MELRHLRDFVAVAEELSFTRAAQKLHVAQPSLTVQIKLLEEELGVRLLDRGKGRVSLTDEGRSFLADTKRVLALSAESVEAVRHRNPRETEQLKIGYVTSLHYHLLPATLDAFHRAYPDVALNLFDMTPAEQLEALEAVKIDLGFIGLRESLREANLAGECVARYETLVAVSHKSPLSKKPRIDLKDIERVFLVGMSERAYPGWQDAVNSSLSLAGLAAPRTLQEADGVQAMLGIVASGMGVALLPEHIKFQRYSGVRFRPLSQPLKVKSWIAWRPDNRSKPLNQYIRIVKGALG